MLFNIIQMISKEIYSQFRKFQTETILKIEL